MDESQVSQAAQIVVAGDIRHRWRFGVTFTSAMGVLSPVIAAIALVSGAVNGVQGYFAILFGVIVVGAAYSFAFCAAWGRKLAHTEYRVYEDRLEVAVGSKVVRTVPRSRIESFAIIGHLDATRSLVVAGPPPSWPYGLISLRDLGPGDLFPNVVLPELMIWGRLEAQEAEWKIQKALRTKGRQN